MLQECAGTLTGNLSKTLAPPIELPIVKLKTQGLCTSFSNCTPFIDKTKSAKIVTEFFMDIFVTQSQYNGLCARKSFGTDCKEFLKNRVKILNLSNDNHPLLKKWHIITSL